MVGESGSQMVTWEEARDLLEAAFEYMAALPDSERGFLAAGYGRRMTSWPEVVRDMLSDYADVDAQPSVQLTRKRAALVERMLTGERPLANAIPEGHRALVGTVCAMRLWPRGEPFSWTAVFIALDGKLWSVRDRCERKVTADAMRKAYERAIGKLTVALDLQVNGFANA